MQNAQVWLDKNYPKDGLYGGFLHMLSYNRGRKREDIRALDIWAIEDVSGSLKLEGFENLEEFKCWWNSITELDISNCPRLEKLICDGNQLRLNQDDTVRNLQIELERERNTVQNLQIELERERNKTKILTSRLESNSQN